VGWHVLFYLSSRY